MVLCGKNPINDTNHPAYKPGQYEANNFVQKEYNWGDTNRPVYTGPA
jgi:hypothetical protein